MSEIGLRQVSKSFGDIEAVRGMSLDIGSGEFVVLLGPTGAGKTTTLRLIAGLERPDRGSISIDGQDVTGEPPAARDVAFVFQQYSLYPHLTVYDNLAFPLRAPSRRLAEAEIRKRVHEVAELLRIGGKLGNRATRLSGGEMQRVAIGRALVRRPAIYLMDEPLSSLDAKLRAELRLELKRIQVDLGATVLYVTHDQIEAMTMASRIGVIREGSLIQLGTPREIYESPDDLYVATRLGSPQINVIPADLLPGKPAPGGAQMVGVRTEHLGDREAGQGQPRRSRSSGRASGRPEPCAHRLSRPGSRHSGRSAPPARGRTGGGTVSDRSALFRCIRAAHSRRRRVRASGMSLDPSPLKSMIAAAAGRVIDSADELTALDQAIGDGDHGVNMKRGCAEVLAQIDAIAAKPTGEALKAIGMALVMKVGGASGPLYGSLFIAMGKALGERPATMANLSDAFAAGVEAVGARGKSTVGRKDDARRPHAGARNGAGRRARSGCADARSRVRAAPPPPSRCAPRRAAPPISASGASATWTLARGPAKSSSKPCRLSWMRRP